jgi:predicted double-glycine peptidase
MLVVRQSTQRADSAVALPVPYVAQSELLCGGAAIAMIERWWGRRSVYAEDFSYLVHPDSGGIFTTDMARVMRARGWDTEALSTTAARLRQSLSDSVPVIALIRVAKNRYHYVVIVAWNDTAITYHDPAVSPFVRIDVNAFIHMWAGANQWAMFVRPNAIVTTSSTVPPHALMASVDSLPCRPFLDQAADAAAANQLDGADRYLAAAVMECPSEPLVLRELAGVRFRQGRHAEVIRLADEYSRRAPSDSLGWQLLASSRYLAGDTRGALQAWNAIGRPDVDLLRIDGTQHVRFRKLASAMGIGPQDVLTPSRFAMAQRRIADVPALAMSRVAYTAVAGGAVEVRAVVVERPVLEPLAQIIAINAVLAAARQDVLLRVTSPLGLGEAWTAHWRWRNADPRVALRLDIPARIGVPGIVSLERSWETYRYSDGVPASRRSASTVAFTSWIRPEFEQRTGTRFERWSGIGDFVALSLGGAIHKAQDRVSLLAEVERGVAISGGPSYDRLRTRGEWTLPPDAWSNSWSMRVGGDWNGAHTPRGLWAIAGGHLSDDIPLRAHQSIVADVLPSARTARAAVLGGVAGDRSIVTVRSVALGVGVFVDAAKLMSTGDSARVARFYVDAGAGVRVSLPGAKWPALRVDVARGLVADRRWGISAGIVRTGALRPGRLR